MGCAPASCAEFIQFGIGLFKDALEVGFFIVLALLIWVIDRWKSDLDALRSQVAQLLELNKTARHTELLPAIQNLVVNWRPDNIFRNPNFPKNIERNARKFAEVPKEENILALFDFTIFRSGKLCLVLGAKGLYWPGRNFLAWRDLPNAEIKEVRDGISIAGKLVPALSDKTGYVAMLIGLQKEIRPFFETPDAAETKIEMRAAELV